MKRNPEALWNGDLAPGQTSGVGDPELKHLTVLMDRSRTASEQKKLLEKYIDCVDEFFYLRAAEAFCDGFILASKFLTEALSDT